MKDLLINVYLLIFLTFILGVIYPAAVYIYAQVFFTDKAMGSLIIDNGQVRGSFLLAQNFVSEKYFWARPSASNYNTLPSSASNLAYSNKDLLKNAQKEGPKDLIFSSGSGLDPHISLDAAYFQLGRVAKGRSLEEDKIKKLIDNLAVKPLYIINVVRLNYFLDQL